MSPPCPHGVPTRQQTAPKSSGMSIFGHGPTCRNTLLVRTLLGLNNNGELAIFLRRTLDCVFSDSAYQPNSAPAQGYNLVNYAMEASLETMVL